MSPFRYPEIMTADWESQIKEQIRRRYAQQILRPPGYVAGDGSAKLHEAGYPTEVIERLPENFKKSYSGCGYLFKGLSFENISTIVDLGSGAGLDSFIAAENIPSGLVIAIDMTAEMLVDIHHRRINPICADIEYLPIESASVDLVIANASFNLAISKEKAFSEAFRILKPTGSLVARDLIKHGDLPAEVLTDPLSFNTSLGGALEESELIKEIKKPGFENITISDHKTFSFVYSVKIKATKPA